MDDLMVDKLPRIDLIKIDVEGAEHLVIEGAMKTIKKFKPKILFEAWNEENLNKVTKLLSKLNYKVISIDGDNYLGESNERI